MSATTAPSSNVGTPPKTLHIGLWVVQGLIAASFFMSGFMKLATPLEQLHATMPWTNGAMGQAVRVIGAVELLGAFGLILPAATRIKPFLTPLAALGLTTVMVLASVTHLSRGETPVIVINAILGGMAAFVAWGRSRKAPITPRAQAQAQGLRADPLARPIR
jgi:uncharacterized membrane protein YphA (DoxX/SURF4 family)